MQNEILIRQLKLKDQRAFSQLYDMYAESILGVIYTILNDQPLSEEVLQDTFFKVWDKADQYDAKKGRFFTWILNIARNKAIDKTRSKAFKQSQKGTDLENFKNVISANCEINDKENADLIKKTIDNLKPLCVKLIDMLFFKGFTQEQTSESLDTPLGTIKSRSRNCLKELRESFNTKSL
mgnify:FL=1